MVWGRNAPDAANKIDARRDLTEAKCKRSQAMTHKQAFSKPAVYSWAPKVLIAAAGIVATPQLGRANGQASQGTPYLLPCGRMNCDLEISLPGNA
jgi:hypothetical protein